MFAQLYRSQTRSQLSEKVDTIITSEYDTGFTYANSRSYKILSVIIIPLLLMAVGLSAFSWGFYDCKRCEVQDQMMPIDWIDNTLNEKIERIIKSYLPLRESDHKKTDFVNENDIINSLYSNITKNSSSLMDHIREMIRDHLRKYDADKTGLPDYALESSGASVIGTGCTVQYEEKSRTQKLFGIPLWFSSYSPRSVIQRKGYGASAGECWAYIGAHGYLKIQLSKRINVTAVSYEHLPIELSPDGHIRTAPKNFYVWSYQHSEDTESKVLLGNFTYEYDGEPLQMFHIQNINQRSSPIVELETITNHGAEVTCLYRFRVHGLPSG